MEVSPDKAAVVPTRQSPKFLQSSDRRCGGTGVRPVIAQI
jgi:hypothetical protein